MSKTDALSMILLANMAVNVAVFIVAHDLIRQRNAFRKFFLGADAAFERAWGLLDETQKKTFLESARVDLGKTEKEK